MVTSYDDTEKIGSTLSCCLIITNASRTSLRFGAACALNASGDAWVTPPTTTCVQCIVHFDVQNPHRNSHACLKVSSKLGPGKSCMQLFKQSMLACRPANQPTAIHPSLQIGIPSFISDKEDQFQLYFVTVQPIAQVTTAPAKLQVGNQQPFHLGHKRGLSV